MHRNSSFFILHFPKSATLAAKEYTIKNKEQESTPKGAFFLIF